MKTELDVLAALGIRYQSMIKRDPVHRVARSGLMSPCAHVTARSFAQGCSRQLQAHTDRAPPSSLPACQHSMTLQRTQYWAASKRYSPLLPQNACGNWVGLLRPRQLYHPGKGVVAQGVLDPSQPWFLIFCCLMGPRCCLGI